MNQGRMEMRNGNYIQGALHMLDGARRKRQGQQ